MFQDLMELINKDDERSKEYKTKLLGHSVIDYANNRYWELQMIVNVEGLLTAWDDLPIHKKAEVRAYYQLNNMAEILRQHQQNMQDNRKAAIEKAKAAKK